MVHHHSSHPSSPMSQQPWEPLPLFFLFLLRPRQKSSNHHSPLSSQAPGDGETLSPSSHFHDSHRGDLCLSLSSPLSMDHSSATTTTAFVILAVDNTQDPRHVWSHGLIRIKESQSDLSTLRQFDNEFGCESESFWRLFRGSCYILLQIDGGTRF